MRTFASVVVEFFHAFFFEVKARPLRLLGYAVCVDLVAVSVRSLILLGVDLLELIYSKVRSLNGE